MRGDREEAPRMIRPFEDKFEAGDVPMASFALVYGVLGDEANAVKWMERSADRREWQALSIAVNGVFAKMENSPGFRALKSKMHLDR